MCNYTGRTLVKCFMVSPQNTYYGVGEVAFGKWGKWLVVGMIMLEFLGALCMVLIMVPNS